MVAHIAVDIGGTHLRAGLFHQDSIHPLRLEQISTQYQDATPLDRLVSLITSIWPENDEVAAIAVAAPGPLNPYEGIIYTTPNIPGWVDLHLSEHLENEFNVPVLLGNDANLAALAEWKYGAGCGHHHLIYLTVSTGIGGGVIVDDRLLLGAHGMAAELGHTTIIPNGPMCGCGQPGHLEALASGTAIANWVEMEIASGTHSVLAGQTNLSAKVIAETAAMGDDLARTAFLRAGKFLGIGIVSFLHIFNPSIVIIGGGVSKSGDLLMSPVRKAVDEGIMSSQFQKGLTITHPEFGDQAGLIGALALTRS
jgi:glucokinase